MADVLLDLPETLRSELKEPMGAIYTDTAALLADAGEPLVAVGDMVTYHLLEAGRVPDLALVDEQTKRSAVDSDVTAAITGFDRTVAVANPAGTLTSELLEAMRAGLDSDATTLVDVDGEEDLAALPAVLMVSETASVVYGQPDEGMVLVTPDGAVRDRVRSILSRMDGDSQAVFDAISSRE
ncbi:GTP-dependent dephospho-CoA kinase family protein [Haloarcula salinisoli]|uniref:GTP-dependent dephospho-CoA kinase n=1 Tax=Haloarcula salinisoli TaxID=2487746 RepID=A0A8J7YK73_9EURY|nr:GTP-dependent dephospho-CoA kinase family protein [Halomicroarcula salinisoli]MBX0286947.1 GTP-dependent dephospho-CoA kinase family protein [Halomicroarcula salinisoli]MBX0304249.1 GTP-dependent dephospho-CoA kinase family protein [Halomicroarcula salinisoli]